MATANNEAKGATIKIQWYRSTIATPKTHKEIVRSIHRHSGRVANVLERGQRFATERDRVFSIPVGPRDERQAIQRCPDSLLIAKLPQHAERFLVQASGSLELTPPPRNYAENVKRMCDAMDVAEATEQIQALFD